ncbi:hypothetical protein [Listeria sp. PSOL-1]|uniref:hypothetical protein n=1 Tax=Listeria sp. PSOL-1 TaxID=1844999 RepID=UPI001E554C61|nr:hypothetical protein [Listeria sp. PSOL-1]
MQGDHLIQSLDHFSLVQAIRYWAVHYAKLDANVGLKLCFSEQNGITAIVQ